MSNSTGIIRCQCMQPLQFKSEDVLVCLNPECSVKGVEIRAHFWVTPISDMRFHSRWSKFEKADV